MGDSICLDTDILVGLLRNDFETVSWIKENEDKFEFVTTAINAFELFAGAHKDADSSKKINDVKELLQTLKILDFSFKICEEAGKQRAYLEQEGLLIDIRDLFIGVIVLVEGFTLKTNNKKHFSRIKGLKII